MKCRPPANRPPTRAESATCRGWTQRQLELAAPAVVVALGLSAARWFLGPGTLASLRGRLHDVDLPGWTGCGCCRPTTRAPPCGTGRRGSRGGCCARTSRWPSGRAGELVAHGRHAGAGPGGAGGAGRRPRPARPGALDDDWAALGFERAGRRRARPAARVALADLAATRRLGERLAAALRPATSSCCPARSAPARPRSRRAWLPGLGVRGDGDQPDLRARPRATAGRCRCCTSTPTACATRGRGRSTSPTSTSRPRSRTASSSSSGARGSSTTSARPGRTSSSAARRGRRRAPDVDAAGRTAAVRVHGPRWSTATGHAAR